MTPQQLRALKQLETAADRLSPQLGADVDKAAAALRRFLIAVGQSPADLRATPGDLARFDLCAWDGLFCGVQCVPSPIAVVER